MRNYCCYGLFQIYYEVHKGWLAGLGVNSASDLYDPVLNTRAALITRGQTEIRRLGLRMGANPRTFTGLAGIGDLILTCTGDLSRNHTVGKKIGLGEKVADILAGMNMVAEGVKSAPTVMALGERYGIEMPIAGDVVSVLQGERTPRQAFRGLLKSTVGAESEPG